MTARMITAAIAVNAMPTVRLSDSVDRILAGASSEQRWYLVGYALAVVASLVFTYLIWLSGSRAQEKILADSEAKIAASNARIAELQSAGEAAKRESDEKIAELNRQADALRLEAESARGAIAAGQAEAARANERAEALELETAKQREKAALAERALLELQQRVADRHLSTEQRTDLVERLSTSPRGEVHLECVGGDPEPCAFAGELADALRAGGWTVAFGESDRGILFGGTSPKGVFLRVQSGTIPRAVALQRALAEVGIQAPGQIVPDLPEDWVKLLVGYK